MLPMDDLLPEDEVLVQRKNKWEDFFLKRRGIQEDEEEEGLLQDELSDVLDNSLEIENQENEIVPEEAIEVVEEPNAASEEESKRSLTKALQLAIKEREIEWKQKGLKFTFNKVDEWLKQSETQNRKETTDPKGGHTVEQSNQRVMQVKRKYRGSTNSKHESDSNEITDESDTEISDASYSNESSVDTAKYIRANQNKRTKVMKKTIIKKYVVTEHVGHRRSSSSKSHSNRLKEPELLPAITAPVPVITEGTTSNPIKKRRKTRHELNQIRSSRIPTKASSSEGPRTEDESQDYLNPRHTEPRSETPSPEKLSQPTEPTPIKSPAQNLSYEEIIKKQPRIVLKPITTNESPTKRGRPRKIQRIVSSESSNASIMNETATNMSVRSICSSIISESRKSWSHLPKRSVLYAPSANASQDSTVNITNQHFEEAFGAEVASELLKAKNFSKEVDATATVVFEIPEFEEEPSGSSDIDPMDILDQFQKPTLKIVRNN